MSNIEISSQRTLRWRVAVICLVLAAITFAVFARTVNFGFVNGDDDFYVYENPVVEGGLNWDSAVWIFTHEDCSFYHPLTMLSLMADYQVHGLHAGGYHLVNIVLHATSVVLLFLIMRQMTGAFWRSAFVAAVFAIHPLRVESVAWVAERKDVLEGFFFMLTLGAYVHYARKPDSRARYEMVVVLFVLALLSKPTAVTLPFVLLLLDYWPLRRFEQLEAVQRPKYFGIPKRLILEKIPLLALAATECVLTKRAMENYMAQTWLTHIAHVSVPLRLGNAVISYAVYLRQMVWPKGLAVFYPFPQNGVSPWKVALAGALLAGLSAVAWRERRRRPWLLVGWLWYAGMLLPMIGIMKVGEYAHADRHGYLPQIGICLAMTWLVTEWAAKWRVGNVVLGSLMAGVIAVLTVCAWKQTAYWENSETLWNRALACTTGNDIAHYDLGCDYYEKGRVDEAITQYREALQIKPDYEDVHAALGIALLRQGKLDEATIQFQAALRTKPDHTVARYNLDLILTRKNNATKLLRHYQEALQLNPAGPEVESNLVSLLAVAHKGTQVVQMARQAKTLTGGENPVILHDIATAFAEAGRFSEARRAVQKAIELARAMHREDLAEQWNGELKGYEAGRLSATAAEQPAKQ